VNFDSAVADAENARHFFAAEALKDQLDDFQFPRRELVASLKKLHGGPFPNRIGRDLIQACILRLCKIDHWGVAARCTSASCLRHRLGYPDQFAPLFESVRPDLHFTIVPGMAHIGMTVAPAGIAAVRKSFLDLTSPATG
jgi:hypothetical protein